MRHMVVYRSIEGGSIYHETDDLDGAVRTVEHLRNSQSITDARIFSLQEIPIEVKTYYRVEVVTPEVARPEPAHWADAPVESAPAPVLESVSTAAPGLPSEASADDDAGFVPPAPVLPAGAGRFGLFSRG